MIVSKLHEDMDSPPNIPAFNSTPKRRTQNESLASALSGVAVAFAKALGESPRPEQSSVSENRPYTTASVSPRKTVDLRMKNYEQLRYLQQLFDDGILSETEFFEQKKNILSFLKNL